MSDNSNPQNLGTINDLFFNEFGTLDANNTEDTFRFNLPTLQSLNPNIKLDKVDFFYGFEGDFLTLNQPVKISVGIDSNSDGVFDENNEIIGSPIIVQDDLEEFTLPDLFTSLSLPEDLLKPDQEIFLNIESTDPNISNNYDLDFELVDTFTGELSTDDSLYCCGNDNSKYYYDRLDELSAKAGKDGVVVGDVFNVALASSSFDPVLFILNQDTGEVIDVAETSTTQTISGVDYQIAELNFTVQDNINYVASVESALPNQTGEYLYQVI